MCAAQESHKDELERLQAAVESERERADRAEGKARAAELLREDLESYKARSVPCGSSFRYART